MRYHGLQGATVMVAIVSALAPGGRVTASLIAYWNMDDLAGSPAALDSVGVADAVAEADLAGGANLPVAGVAGIVGTAWSFDETNDSVLRVLAPNQAVFTTLGPAGGGFTYSGWINSTNATGPDTIFSISDTAAGSEEAALRINAGNLSFLARHNTLDNVDVTGGFVADGVWHHVAVTSDGTGGTILYLDGNPTASSPFGVDIATFTTNPDNITALFGGNDDNSAVVQWEYLGLIDEFSVYNTALSPSLVAFLAANPGSVIPEPSSMVLLVAGILLFACQRQRP